MSLINDALKRAQESQKPDTRSSVSSLRTIEVRSKDRRVWNRLMLVVIFLLLAAAFAFIGVALTGHLTAKKTAAPTVPHVPQIQIAAPAAAPIPPPVLPKVVAPVIRVAQPATPPVVTNVPLVLPDTLHVQGVANDPTRPWAIVSGKLVHVGDLVKGVRVMNISRDSVTFGSNGQTNLLFVGQ